ncbi:MAG: signal peptidase I [Patescibacteria group bacterium]|nr:signal peptidase I [Patescibacteria group bacterium]MDD5121007.1 signal peptidase I [Patescibacteria group bacterium]MDD5221632.1 signal peptidase I [Patescibacteria group bacterium]MDD5396074.1 signal peptidase I [Patescibacteria group bacterium]
MQKFRFPGWVSFLWDVVKLVIIAFIIVWPIHKFVFQPFLVQGPSMEPNFYDREYLIVEEVSHHFVDPQRGEVVVLRSPYNSREYLIKRIIALPGERIVIKEGNIWIYNGKNPQGVKVEENYLPAGLNTGGEVDQMLAVDQYYVLGDNRSVSLDSRSFGPVQRGMVIGRVWLRGWPLNRLANFRLPTYQF